MANKKTTSSTSFEYKKILFGALITFALGILGKFVYDYLNPNPQYQFMVNIFTGNKPAKTSALNIYENAEGMLEYEGTKVNVSNFQYMPESKLFFDAVIDQKHLNFGSLYTQNRKSYFGSITDDYKSVIGTWEAVEKPK